MCESDRPGQVAAIKCLYASRSPAFARREAQRIAFVGQLAGGAFNYVIK